MGFSLGRALAGAIAGGAGAVSEIADMQIKEAAVSRQREADFERQRQLMREQDEIMAMREQRVADTKQRVEKEKRDEIAGFMRTQLSALKEKGVDSGSIEGQRAIASAAAEAGYQDYADKFYDNAIRLGQIESVAESNRESRQLRAQNMQLATADAAARRAESTDRKNAEREEKEELKRQGDIFRLGKVAGGTDREGKAQTYDATPRMIGVYREAMDSGLPPAEAFGAALSVRKGIDIALNKGVDFETAADKSVLAVTSQWRAPEPKKPTPAPVPQAQAPVPPKEKYIPSAFEAAAEPNKYPDAPNYLGFKGLEANDPYRMAEQARLRNATK